VTGLPGGVLVVGPWLCGYLAGGIWGKGRNAWRGAGQFTTIDLWPHAIEAANLDSQRWSRTRVDWAARIMFAAGAIALIAAVTVGDWSVSLR
jgi:hypothetical protein